MTLSGHRLVGRICLAGLLCGHGARAWAVEAVVASPRTAAWLELARDGVSHWLPGLCVAGAVLVVWGARRAATRARRRYEGRLEQRERAARELNDRLLQSMQGLMLQVQAAADRLSTQDPTRLALDEALERGEAVLAVGRGRLADRRRASPEPLAELPDALAAVGCALGDGRDVRFQAVTWGRPQALRPEVQNEIYRIACEALANAFRHARADAIEIEVTYADDQLRVRVSDDGIGLDVKTLEDDGRRDRWGVVEMREWAGQIGAGLSLWSRPGAGTEMDLMLAAAQAYLGPTRSRRGLLGSRDA